MNIFTYIKQALLLLTRQTLSSSVCYTLHCGIGAVLNDNVARSREMTDVISEKGFLVAKMLLLANRFSAN